MRHGIPPNRIIQNELTNRGIITCILRIGKNRYQMIVNYEVIREYKSRRSCNKYIYKLYTGVIKVIKQKPCRKMKSITVRRFKKRKAC